MRYRFCELHQTEAGIGLLHHTETSGKGKIFVVLFRKIVLLLSMCANVFVLFEVFLMCARFTTPSSRITRARANTLPQLVTVFTLPLQQLGQNYT